MLHYADDARVSALFTGPDLDPDQMTDQEIDALADAFVRECEEREQEAGERWQEEQEELAYPDDHLEMAYEDRVSGYECEEPNPYHRTYSEE